MSCVNVGVLVSDVDVTCAVTMVVSVNEAVASVLVVTGRVSGTVIAVEVRSMVVSGVITVAIVLTAAGVLVKTCAGAIGVAVSSAVDVGLVAADVGEREDLVMEVEAAEEEVEGARVLKTADVAERSALLGASFVGRGVK